MREYSNIFITLFIVMGKNFYFQLLIQNMFNLNEVILTLSPVRPPYGNLKESNFIYMPKHA